MARICAFVFNSASRDARVLKQAASLVEAGHAVTVIGVADRKQSVLSETLDNGVTILRIKPQRPPRSTNKKRKKSLIYFAILAIFIVYSYISYQQDNNLKIQILYYTLILACLAYLIFQLNVPLSIARKFFGKYIRYVFGEGVSIRLKSLILNKTEHYAPELLTLETNRRFSVRSKLMAEAAYELQPDIVHCHDVDTLPAGALVKKQLGCQLVYDAHEIYEEVAKQNSQGKRYAKFLHNKYLPVTDGFITINESIAGWYEEHYPNLPTPTILKNAAKKAPPFGYDGRLHDAAELANDERILLYQGGFAPNRGLDFLVASAEFLPPDWTLVMMGWGGYEDHLMDLAKNVARRTKGREHEQVVRFIPPAPQNELHLWTAGATIGVIPYENIGLNHWFCSPNKLWEYPNAGVPVLVSPFPEMRNMVESFGFGWMLPEAQIPEALAHQIANLSEDDISQARAACTRFIEADNWDVYGKRLVALYDEISSRQTQAREDTSRLLGSGKVSAAN